jgi:hypothetical protein
MWMFEYSFDYLFTGEPWFGTVITTAELFKRVGPNSLRDSRWKFPCFRFAGWHSSSFGNADHVCNKDAVHMHTRKMGVPRLRQHKPSSFSYRRVFIRTDIHHSSVAHPRFLYQHLSKFFNGYV